MSRTTNVFNTGRALRKAKRMPYTLEQCGWLRRSELDDLHKGDVWEHPNGLLYILYPNNEELKTVYAPIPRLRNFGILKPTSR
jgi:hypothetical protein